MTEGPSERPSGGWAAERVASRAHFFSRTLGDGWVEVEPGIYRRREEVDGEETLDGALAGALPPADDAGEQHEDQETRLKRWLHR